MRSETKIEVRNEDWPPGCLSQRLKIGTRHSYGDRYCFPIYPPPFGVVGIRGKLVLEISGGKCFRWRGNDLPAVLSHADPRLKILMAPPWCAQ